MEHPEALRYFRPYPGNKPYLFISYAHLNSAEVLSVITALRYAELPSSAGDADKRGRLLIWYDEGIDAGADWASSIAEHMRGCDTVLFFPSKEAFASGNCLAEIRVAKSLNKPVYCIPLDAAAAPSVAKDGKETWQELMTYCTFLQGEAGAAARANALLRVKEIQHLTGTEADYSRQVKSGGFNPWLMGIVIAGLLLLAVIVGIGGTFLGLWQFPQSGVPSAYSVTPSPLPTATPAPTPVYTVPGTDILKEPVKFSSDGQLEAIVRAQLDKESGTVYSSELYAFTELSVLSNRDVNEAGASVTVSESGKIFLNGAELTVKGKVADLSVIGQMVNLSKLSLIKQPLTDLSTLSGKLNLLTELDLSCSDTVSLWGIANCPNLRVLHIEHTGIKDLTVLSSLKSLETVYVSRDMLPLTLDSNAGYNTVLVH